VSNYYIDNSPEDGIAYWDFNVPHDKYSYIPRDSSSAAITASALFELLVNGTTAGPNAAKGNSDLALTYGDYYFIKALHHLMK
jgi:unsaturated chondroitin disaccharide hydrolase